MLGSTCASAQTWLESVKVKWLNLQYLVMKLFFSFSTTICCLLYSLSPRTTHKQTHTFSVRNSLHMLGFDCPCPRKLNGVIDLYRIECEMTSNLTLKHESHTAPSASLLWPAAPYFTISDLRPRAGIMSRLEILSPAFSHPQPPLLRDLLLCVRRSNNKSWRQIITSTKCWD